MAFNATFNNISVSVEETGENQPYICIMRSVRYGEKWLLVLMILMELLTITV